MFHKNFTHNRLISELKLLPPNYQSEYEKNSFRILFPHPLIYCLSLLNLFNEKLLFIYTGESNKLPQFTSEK